MSETAEHAHHTIDYIELTVTNLAEATRFYGAAFGWRFNDYGPGYAGIQGDGREVGGFREDPAARTAGLVGAPLVILYSKNLEDSLAKVRAAGGKIVKEPFSFPGGRRFHFLDPFGNQLATWGP